METMADSESSSSTTPTSLARRSAAARSEALAAGAEDTPGQWTHLASNTFRMLTHGLETTIEGGLAMQQALQTYADTRMQRQIDLIERMRSACNVNEAIQLQAEYGFTAVEDTLKAASDMASIGYRTWSAGWTTAA
jgi:hypothetical protein